jgi:hypothetical protein
MPPYGQYTGFSEGCQENFIYFLFIFINFLGGMGDMEIELFPS